MKTLRLVPFLIFICFFLGCGVQYSTPSGVNLNQYRYVCLPSASEFVLKDDASRSDIFAVNARLSKLFTKEGLKVLDKSQLENLTAGQRCEVLVLAFQCKQQEGVTSFAFYLYDCTGRKVFASYAEDGIGFDVMESVRDAVDRAFIGFAKNYSGYDSGVFVTSNEYVGDKAIPTMRSVIENCNTCSMGDYAFHYSSLATLLDMEGRADEAIETLNTAISYAPANSDYHIALAQLLQRQGRENEAAKAYDKAARMQNCYQNPRVPRGMKRKPVSFAKKKARPKASAVITKKMPTIAEKKPVIVQKKVVVTQKKAKPKRLEELRPIGNKPVVVVTQKKE